MDKPILELLTFVSNLDFRDFGPLGLKSEVRGPRKNCVHFRDQNLKMTQLTFPMRPNGQERPICRDPATLEKIEKIDENLPFYAFWANVSQATMDGAL